MTQPEKFSTFRAQVTEAKEGTITGIAVKYNVPVERGEGLFEKVMPGAFKAQVNAANRIPILWQHNREAPIGRVREFKDSPGKLDFQALISSNPDIPEATKALALLREDIIDEMSIGFDWGNWHEEREDGKLTIVHTKARLREISVVTAGALGREARVISVHADGQGIDIALIRARLAKLTS